MLFDCQVVILSIHYYKNSNFCFLEMVVILPGLGEDMVFFYFIFYGVKTGWEFSFFVGLGQDRREPGL